MNPPLRRRGFLAGASALAALRTLAADSGAGRATPGHYDLIVVGAGTAGLPAAIFASRRGARVLLLDAGPVIGGTLLLSTGMVAAAGTRLQARLGIVDSPQAHYEDVMRISRNTADPDLTRLTVDNAGATFDWLMEHGFEPLPGQPVLGQGHEFYRARRYAWGADGGRTILAVLQRELEPELASGRVRLELSTPVTALLTDDSGAVQGVRVQSGDVERVFSARHVVLASGGYAGNPTLFEQLNGVRHYARLSYPLCQGAGIELGVSVGGYVRGRQNYLSNFGAIFEDEEYPSTVLARWQVMPQKRAPWEIYVNAIGERFVREDEASVDLREHALRHQPDLRYWIVFDRPILEQAPVGVQGWTRDELMGRFNHHPMFQQADTLEELAKRIGANPATLAATVRRYNEGVRSGHDALGRTNLPRAIDGAPYFAVRQQGYSITSTVGLAVDKQLRVVRPGGEPVVNLYAAGELLGSGQTMGNAFVGGMMVTPAITFGRLLGSSLPIGPA